MSVKHQHYLGSKLAIIFHLHCTYGWLQRQQGNKSPPQPLHLSAPLTLTHLHTPLPAGVSPHIMQGPSFSVDGWHVHWQKWDLQLGFNGREGLVLYDVGYTDEEQGRLKSEARGSAHWRGRGVVGLTACVCVCQRGWTECETYKGVRCHSRHSYTACRGHQ